MRESEIFLWPQPKMHTHALLGQINFMKHYEPFRPSCRLKSNFVFMYKLYYKLDGVYKGPSVLLHCKNFTCNQIYFYPALFAAFQFVIHRINLLAWRLVYQAEEEGLIIHFMFLEEDDERKRDQGERGRKTQVHHGN